MPLRQATAILAVLFLSACRISSNAPSTQNEFIESTGLASYKTVAFLDESGKQISYEQFIALTKNGRSFSMMKNPDASEASIRIEKAGSQTTTNISEEPKLAVSRGQPAPKIDSPDLNGVPVVYSEKPTLISFFFAECAPCIKEIPQINKLAQGNPDIEWISLTFDENSQAADFVEKYKLQTRVVADEQKFIDAMGVKTFPLYALIGKDGRLLGTQSGATLQLPMGETIFKMWIRSKLGT